MPQPTLTWANSPTSSRALCPRWRWTHHLGFRELRLITTLTSFATAADVTLSELHLEAVLPADEGDGGVLRGRAHAS